MAVGTGLKAATELTLMIEPPSAGKCFSASLVVSSRSENVDVEMPAVVRLGDVLDGGELVDAGIVDEDVEPAESLLRRIEQRLDVGCL